MSENQTCQEKEDKSENSSRVVLCLLQVFIIIHTVCLVARSGRRTSLGLKTKPGQTDTWE